MSESETYIQTLRDRLLELRGQWLTGAEDFWDFIAAEGGIAPRGVYNFATGRSNAQNARLSTIKGVEQGIAAAEKVLATQQDRLMGSIPVISC